MHSNVIIGNFRRKPAAHVRVPLDRTHERRGPGLLWWFSKQPSPFLPWL
jgi:hypothetical protein